MIPYGRQDVTEADIAAVSAVLRSDFLTQGPEIPRFEAALAAACGAKHAVAVNSATSALHIACLALGLGPGDLLWTSPNTFVASANCGRYCGADVDFVDVEPTTGNMSAAALEAKLVDAERAGRLPKIVVPVHFAGLSCDMAAIHALGQRYGFRIIEDASHAVGGRYRDEPVGNCRHSDITVLSFHPVKIVTTAEGGAALTQDDTLAKALERLRTHGITRDPAQMVGEPDGPWYYEQIELGYNYRLTDLHAALGRSQLDRLGEYVARRAELAERYDALLGDLPLTLPGRRADTSSAWHLYVVRVDEPAGAPPRRTVFDRLRAAGIGVNVHYIPVHWQPYYQALGFRRGQFPQAEAHYAEAISLPLFPLLTDERQDEVVAALRRALGR
ncbi:UDP-4-amino-4,6-dideoxy-N-acetyl-beta-L-altrosamine transaminase [Ideonella sp.]|uniref:UDP-4-amino-4, 6-dideoxy-N-acetyl-beta-L-altrosamine transaminase n=1 Tax=Ideonella sp. TaxID=1929293 RepID=UPI002B4663AA|nr:UDP-4-amino-4,6-dideoxy-N-acetyl-beta-L-altrosamine transaminase [Ideonella sp.]HJV67913.1 UDP-4-amino-4,6-dideoxy-N-acetyl-beta-L-altrosamine transaminase [Ideonella sp.]